MKLWTREWAGWFLIALGLYIFFRCYVLFTMDLRRPVIEGMALTVVGIIVFRGGIHLVKVATAARICLQTQEERDSPGSSVPAVAKSSNGRRIGRDPQRI